MGIFMSQRQVQREVRWNVESEPNPETHHWKILVINDTRAANNLLQRVYEQLQPVDSLTTITEGHIKRARVKYKLVSFDTYKSVEPDWKKIYRGKVVRDRALTARNSPDGLAKYIDEIMFK